MISIHSAEGSSTEGKKHLAGVCAVHHTHKCLKKKVNSVVKTLLMIVLLLWQGHSWTVKHLAKGWWVCYRFTCAPISSVKHSGTSECFHLVWVSWGKLGVKELHCKGKLWERKTLYSHCRNLSCVLIITMTARGNPQQPVQMHPLSSASESTSWCPIQAGWFSELDLVKGYIWRSSVLLFFGKPLSFRVQVLQNNSHLANFGQVSACPLTRGSASSFKVAMFKWIYWCVKHREKWKAYQHAGIKFINCLSHKE